jgi:hypothetical protein
MLTHKAAIGDGGMEGKKLGRSKVSFILSLIAYLLSLAGGFAACELYQYGKLEGADKTETLRPGESAYESLMPSLSGVWYSHYAGIGRLDGYRIGKWVEFDAVMNGKTALLPDLDPSRQTYTNESGSYAPAPNDYFLFYDSSVYGQQDDSEAVVEPGWNFGFLGIVRAVNVFNGDKGRGAIIIEYLKGAAPAWDADIKDGQLPFFGIYYRALSPDIMQLANAVDLAALYKGKKYYTEKATLQEAIAANTVENEAEYISWGVVIPQDREKN